MLVEWQARGACDAPSWPALSGVRWRRESCQLWWRRTLRPRPSHPSQPSGPSVISITAVANFNGQWSYHQKQPCDHHLEPPRPAPSRPPPPAPPPPPPPPPTIPPPPTTNTVSTSTTTATTRTTRRHYRHGRQQQQLVFSVADFSCCKRSKPSRPEDVFCLRNLGNSRGSNNNTVARASAAARGVVYF